MDILASILAYLGCATGIVGALAISFFVFFSTLNPGAGPKPAVAIAAKSDRLQTATVATIPTAATKQSEQRVAAVAPPQPAAPALVAAVGHRKTHLSRPQLRELVQEERAKRWAYQQDADFEARFLGYAD
jgi:hypothetical protein